jgi:hypothetical protein
MVLSIEIVDSKSKILTTQKKFGINTDIGGLVSWGCALRIVIGCSATRI